MSAAQSTRNKTRERDPKERAKDFGEVSQGFDLVLAKKEAERCLNCKHAPCKNGCPVGVQIPEFLAALKNGDTKKAAEIIKQTNGLPAVCGRVCPQEMQCEKLCVRVKAGGAVAIGACERFVGDSVLDATNGQGGDKPVKNGNYQGKRVAVIGSGPAGLSCAADLAQNGVSVTVFEAFHKLGGVLTYGIPEFRLPKAIVQKEIDALTRLGVVFERNTVVGKTLRCEDLIRDFDAIFIGSGAGLPIFMGIPGEGLNGVLSANEYLTRVNLMGAHKKDSRTPVMRGKNVVVVGAGNVAMDAARTALRLGAETVRIVYRRSKAEVPARAEEVLHAEEEGVIFEFLTNPIEVLGENGCIKAVRCVRMELGEPDASGRRAPIEIAGSEFVLETDLFIVALGTSPNPLLRESFDALTVNKRGTFIVDEAMMTSVDGIYAGGDAVTGAATVISAMGQGRAAAKSILKRFAEQTV